MSQSILHFSSLLCQISGDVGGYMGLLCGMSVITIGEMIDFILLAIIKRWYRKQTEDPK